MEVKLTDLLTRLQESKENLSHLEINLKEARVKGRHGLQDILSKRKYLAKIKVNDLLDKLLKWGRGNIIIITFEVIKESGFSLPYRNVRYYTNISREDAEKIHNLWAVSKGYKVNILEIEERHTHKTYREL